MNRLIRNEIFKLYRRHFIFPALAVVLLVCVLYTYFFSIGYNPRPQDQQITDQLESEKAYLAQIENIQWGTDIEMQGAVLSSQATIERLQYMLDHDIALWDWRSDLLEEYYKNETMISLLENGQDPEEYGYELEEDAGSLSETQIIWLTNLVEQQMALIEDDDYMSYSQMQLAEKQQLYNERFAEMDTYETMVMEAEIESLKQYIEYQTPPEAQDQWKSIAISQIREAQEKIAAYQYGEDAGKAGGDRIIARQKHIIRINEYALSQDTMPLSIYMLMTEQYSGEPTYASFLYGLRYVMVAVVLVGIVLGAMLISGEFAHETIKNLVIYPYRRSTLAASKLLTMLFVTLGLSVIVMLYGTIVGRVFFSGDMIGTTLSAADTPPFITYMYGFVIEIPFAAYIFIVFACEFLSVFMMGLLSMMLAILTHSLIAPVSIVTVLAIGGNYIFEIVYTYVYPVKLFRYLLFSNLNLVQYVNDQQTAPYATLSTSVVVIAVCLLLMLGVYFYSFIRKEIQN